MVNLVFKDIKLILRPGSICRIQVLYVKHPCVNMIFYVVMGMLSSPHPKKHSNVYLLLKSVEVLCLDFSNDLGLSLPDSDIIHA